MVILVASHQFFSLPYIFVHVLEIHVLKKNSLFKVILCVRIFVMNVFSQKYQLSMDIGILMYLPTTVRLQLAIRRNVPIDMMEIRLKIFFYLTDY